MWQRLGFTAAACSRCSRSAPPYLNQCSNGTHMVERVLPICFCCGCSLVSSKLRAEVGPTCPASDCPRPGFRLGWSESARAMQAASAARWHSASVCALLSARCVCLFARLSEVRRRRGRATEPSQPRRSTGALCSQKKSMVRQHTAVQRERKKKGKQGENDIVLTLLELDALCQRTLAHTARLLNRQLAARVTRTHQQPPQCIAISYSQPTRALASSPFSTMAASSAASSVPAAVASAPSGAADAAASASASGRLDLHDASVQHLAVYGTLRDDDDSGAEWTVPFLAGLVSARSGLVDGAELYRSNEGPWPFAMLHPRAAALREEYALPTAAAATSLDADSADASSVLHVRVLNFGGAAEFAVKLRAADVIEGFNPAQPHSNEYVRRKVWVRIEPDSSATTAASAASPAVAAAAPQRVAAWIYVKEAGLTREVHSDAACASQLLAGHERLRHGDWMKRDRQRHGGQKPK